MIITCTHKPQFTHTIPFFFRSCVLLMALWRLVVWLDSLTRGTWLQPTLLAPTNGHNTPPPTPPAVHVVSQSLHWWSLLLHCLCFCCNVMFYYWILDIFAYYVLFGVIPSCINTNSSQWAWGCLAVAIRNKVCTTSFHQSQQSWLITS